MARNAAAQDYPSTKALCFWVLLICLWSMIPIGDAASLCYSFTVGKSESGSWWHKVQGQLNEKTFITCDSNNNCHATGPLRDRLNVTDWETQFNTLQDGVYRFKIQVIDMKQENNTIREPFTAQIKQCCWHEADGNFNASCALYLNGQKVLYLHPSTGEWTKVDPGSMWIKEMWEKNKDLTGFLYRTSQGDCKAWLKEIKMSYLEEKLEPTGSTSRAPDITQLPTDISFPPTTDSNKLQYEKIFISMAVIAVLLPLAVGIFVKKYCTQEGAFHAVPQHPLESNLQSLSAAASGTSLEQSPSLNITAKKVTF